MCPKFNQNTQECMIYETDSRVQLICVSGEEYIKGYCLHSNKWKKSCVCYVANIIFNQDDKANVN